MFLSIKIRGPKLSLWWVRVTNSPFKGDFQLTSIIVHRVEDAITPDSLMFVAKPTSIIFCQVFEFGRFIVYDLPKF